MPVLVRIAFRNLLEHKAKSLIIGILLAIGVVILIVGNSFMDTAARGVKDTFIGNYTGDIFISAKAKSPVSLFGVQSVGGQEATPIVPFHDKIVERLGKEAAITGITSQVTGFALLSPKDDDEKQGFALLFGIDPASYYTLFQNAVAVEGSLLEPGQEGILISKKQIDEMEKNSKFRPKVGDTLILTGMGKAGFKIRAVPLRGIIAFKTESEATSFISYADANTVRILSGLTLGNDDETPISEEQKSLLAATDEQELFGGETVLASKPVVPSAPAAPRAAQKPAPRKATEIDQGAWHFIMARAKNPAEAQAVIASMNAYFASEGIEAQAAGWKTAAGPFAQSIDVVRIVFNVAIIIVAIVAVIIMMNTLVISVIERTGEIGTMRALGAQKSFVRKMFLAETLTIAGVFGIIGMAIAFAVIAILSAANIQATNPFLEILFAGKVLHPSVNPASVAWSLVLVALVAVAAHLYPVSLALRVEPVRAMQTE
jgi:putative ABC transport system permease protein